MTNLIQVLADGAMEMDKHGGDQEVNETVVASHISAERRLPNQLSAIPKISADQSWWDWEAGAVERGSYQASAMMVDQGHGGSEHLGIQPGRAAQGQRLNAPHR
jgi:hypothetical protein